MNIELNALERNRLVASLPKNVGSLQEAHETKALRDDLRLTDDEREQLDLDQEGGSISIDTFKRLEGESFFFTDLQMKIIGYGFLEMEQKNQVPTGDIYLDLIDKFSEGIELAREELEG